MSSAAHQDPETQSVHGDQDEVVQVTDTHVDDALDCCVQTGDEKEHEADFEVSFEVGDPNNPKEWSSWRRAWALFCISFSCFIVSLYSTIYTSSIPGVSKAFDLHLPVVPTLGITTYLIGTGTGSLIQAPLSELFGRRPIYLISLVIFTLLILPCALATSISEILAVRFFG